MIRSGSTWSFNVSLEILKAQIRTAIGVHSPSFKKTFTELDGSVADFVFKSHELDDFAVEMILAGEAKAIYTHRDPLDAIVSTMSIFDLSFDEAFHHMATSIRTLKQLLDIRAGLLISYEQLMTDPYAAVARIATYLGQPLTGLAIAEIADRTTLDKMRIIADSLDSLPAVRVCPAPANWAYDRETLLHRNHIQDSRSGKGLERLEIAQIRRVHAEFGDVLCMISRYCS